MFDRQPALRHFAVLAKGAKTRYGKIWRVHDRRSELKLGILFVPNRKRIWPIWLEIIKETKPSPVRLRNGTVAILVPGTNTEQLRCLLKIPRNERGPTLDVMTGFKGEKPKRGSKWMLVTGAGLLLLIGIAASQLTIPKEGITVPPKVIDEVQSCSAIPEVGFSFPKGIKAGSKVTIGDSAFLVGPLKQFGGLTQVVIKRSCDGKRFKMEAWVNKSNYEIAKVY